MRVVFRGMGAVFGGLGLLLCVAGAAFREILGKCVSLMRRERSPKRRVRDDDFIFGLSSDYRRIMLESSLYWRKQFRELPLKS